MPLKFNTALGQINPFDLKENKVHIWGVESNKMDALADQFKKTLSDDERKRAEHFYFDYLRKSFIISHGALRTILSYYISTKPEQVKFRFGEHGKPYLDWDSPLDVRFNITHSRELTLIAITLGRELGIDLEAIRPIRDLERLAERFFSPDENSTLQTVPVHQRLEAFFNCWTLKEAYIKATGEGFSRPFRTFDVAFLPRDSARIVNVAGSPKESERWSLIEFSPAGGYIAALAIEASDSTEIELRISEWSKNI